MACVVSDCSADTGCGDRIQKTKLCPQASEMRAISVSRQTGGGDRFNFELLLAKLELD